MQLFLLGLLIVLFFLLNISFYKKRIINIYIGNSFQFYYTLPDKPFNCLYKNIRYVCHFSDNQSKLYDASIYNGNKYFPKRPNFSYNIIMTTEKLSQVNFMKDIGEGKSKSYNLAIDYRAFTNRWHISVPIYKNLSNFIILSKYYYGNLKLFMKRKSKIVYIQRVKYKNRQYLVKEIMKHFDVDSFGKDLKNKDWPKNISKNNKIDIIKQYKFCLAIENSVIYWKRGNTFEADLINNDYITAKLTDCLLAGSIPIYFGAKNVNNFLPDPNSVINMNQFSIIENLTNYLTKIENNYSLLLNHLSWHNNYSSEWYRKNNIIFSYCNICNYVMKYGL